ERGVDEDLPVGAHAGERRVEGDVRARAEPDHDGALGAGAAAQLVEAEAQIFDARVGIGLIGCAARAQLALADARQIHAHDVEAVGGPVARELGVEAVRPDVIVGAGAGEEHRGAAARDAVGRLREHREEPDVAAEAEGGLAHRGRRGGHVARGLGDVDARGVRGRVTRAGALGREPRRDVGEQLHRCDRLVRVLIHRRVARPLLDGDVGAAGDERLDELLIGRHVVAMDDQHAPGRRARQLGQIDLRQRLHGRAREDEAARLLVTLVGGRVARAPLLGHAQHAELARQRLARAARAPQDEAIDVVARARRQRRQRRAEPHAEEPDARDAAEPAQLVDGGVDALRPRGDAVGIFVAPGGVAGAVIVEVQDRDAAPGEHRGELAQRAVRAHQLRADRRADHHAEPGRHAHGRVVEREQRAPVMTRARKVDRPCRHAHAGRLGYQITAPRACPAAAAAHLQSREGSTMRIDVECYAGYRAEETPRAVLLGERRVEVIDVVDRWLAPDHRYFKLRGDDGALYIIRYDSERDEWELAVYSRAD